MKKYICFIVTLFVFVNMSLFAFENEYFKVNDSKWTKGNPPPLKGNSAMFAFILKDFEEVDASGKKNPPSIHISVKNNADGKTHYIKDEKGFLEQHKKDIARDSADGEKMFKELMLKIAMAQMPNTPKSQIEKMVDKEYEQSGGTEIGSTFYTRIGEHRAVEGNYRIGVIWVKSYLIYTLTRIYYIEVKYFDGIDMDNLPAFKEFMSSLILKDRVASKFNSETLPTLITLSIGLVGSIIGGVVYFVVKKNVA